MKIKLLLCLLILAVLPAAAQVELSETEKFTPNDEVFMDMAVTAAKTSAANGQTPCGAVIILNGAWRSTGMPSEGVTAEETALRKARAKSLEHGAIYTVFQPTTAACKAIAGAKVGAVYYAIDADTAVAAGIYPASAYEGESVLTVPVHHLPITEADSLLRSK